MADRPPDSQKQASDGLDRGSTHITPRWVKVFAIIGIVLVLAFVTLHLTGHSPGGHSFGEPGAHPPSSRVTAHSVQQP